MRETETNIERGRPTENERDIESDKLRDRREREKEIERQERREGM